VGAVEPTDVVQSTATVVAMAAGTVTFVGAARVPVLTVATPEPVDCQYAEAGIVPRILRTPLTRTAATIASRRPVARR
jgi:hypothetical protein